MVESMNGKRIAGMVLAVTLTLLVLFVGFFGVLAVGKSFSRYQKRADANNRVKVSEIEIKNQAQRVQITKQQAQIRYETAKGVREAQDEIAKTLTPLYVQFEMVEALKQIVSSRPVNEQRKLWSGNATRFYQLKLDANQLI
jgi:biopolymer transport protein ExbB/TolQ